ncbi:hypothetical protein RJ640_004898 [Escallonia rubra]|uniref:Uncharacterized protein n=1 Tax=Escallonia rubra TaxID=112253 RepID=A0AA88UCJ0_9ASTE|nr:hypothetical protein RJ640_004898 [Escallonia rubra]
MGKRKERRLAAMSSAGRRVKLDLFAEPSGTPVSLLSIRTIVMFDFVLMLPGDLGGSSDKGEVGGDDDSNSRAGLPNSPSSSGGFRQFSSKGLSLCREDMI